MSATTDNRIANDAQVAHSLQGPVSCIVCGSPNGKHELREMSPRCGKYLCDECKRKEADAKAAWRWLCS